jgi:hypothetical protein
MPGISMFNFLDKKRARATMKSEFKSSAAEISFSVEVQQEYIFALKAKVSRIRRLGSIMAFVMTIEFLLPYQRSASDNDWVKLKVGRESVGCFKRQGICHASMIHHDEVAGERRMSRVSLCLVRTDTGRQYTQNYAFDRAINPLQSSDVVRSLEFP